MHKVFERGCSDSFSLQDFSVSPVFETFRYGCVIICTRSPLQAAAALQETKPGVNKSILSLPAGGIHDSSACFGCFSALPAAQGNFACSMNAGLSLRLGGSGNLKKKYPRE